MILLDPLARPIVAHRGASGDFPENTILAFERGVALGADALEFDVRLSSDGVPVVIHDPTVERTTNGKGAVRDLTARELATLDAGLGQGVSTVAEVLEVFCEIPLIVEIKETPAAIPLADVLRRHGATGRVLVGSFQHAALRGLSRFGLNRSASRRETATSWIGSRFGFVPRYARYEAFTVPAEYNGLRVVDERFVSTATRQGLPVHVWTVDDPAEAERLRALGIAGIITNHPDRMKSLKRS